MSSAYSNSYWKGDIMNCSCYKEGKLLEHGMNGVEVKMKMCEF